MEQQQLNLLVYWLSVWLAVLRPLYLTDSGLVCWLVYVRLSDAESRSVPLSRLHEDVMRDAGSVRQVL